MDPGMCMRMCVGICVYVCVVYRYVYICACVHVDVLKYGLLYLNQMRCNVHIKATTTLRPTTTSIREYAVDLLTTRLPLNLLRTARDVQ